MKTTFFYPLLVAAAFVSANKNNKDDYDSDYRASAVSLLL